MKSGNSIETLKSLAIERRQKKPPIQALTPQKVNVNCEYCSEYFTSKRKYNDHLFAQHIDNILDKTETPRYN